MRHWNGIELATRIEAADGRPIEREHFEIVNQLGEELTLKDIEEKLRSCKRPATIRRIDL